MLTIPREEVYWNDLNTRWLITADLQRKVCTYVLYSLNLVHTQAGQARQCRRPHITQRGWALTGLHQEYCVVSHVSVPLNYLFGKILVGELSIQTSFALVRYVSGEWKNVYVNGSQCHYSRKKRWKHRQIYDTLDANTGKSLHYVSVSIHRANHL